MLRGFLWKMGKKKPVLKAKRRVQGGSTHRMKWSREKRSSSLFWIGVPVTAHRLRAFSE
jgi:hypothetical protein